MERNGDAVKVVGHAVRVMEDGHGEAAFRVSELRKLLCGGRGSNTRLAVVSIVGTMRKGKSFLMNLIVRYLSSKCDSHWASNLDQETEGFPWSPGLDRNTVGIHVWSELFKMKINNEDVVILLVDTQGMFGKLNTFEEYTTIAALTLLMSSYQILNIEYFFDETMSDFIETFVNYAVMIIDQWCVKNPFQNILGLVRDWVNPSEYPYGFQGGESFFSSNASIKSVSSDQQQFKKYYKQLFNKMQYFLMPHPGMKASNYANFDGKLRDVDKTFIEQLKILIPSIISPENLSPRKINDHYLTCKEFYYYFKSLVVIINRSNFPRISNIITENGNLNKWEIFDEMNSKYISEIDKFCEEEHDFITEEKMINEHLRVSGIINENIDKSKKFNAEIMTDDLRLLITNRLNNLHLKFSIDNSNKNIKLGIFTPYSLIILLGICYIMSCIGIYVNIKVIMIVMDIIFYMSLSLVWLWIFSFWYELEEVSAILDVVSDILILYFYNPVIVAWKNKPAKLLDSLYETIYSQDDSRISL